MDLTDPDAGTVAQRIRESGLLRRCLHDGEPKFAVVPVVWQLRSSPQLHETVLLYDVDRRVQWFFDPAEFPETLGPGRVSRSTILRPARSGCIVRAPSWTA